MPNERSRLLFRVAVVAFVLAFLAAAIVPGDAWSPGSPALADVPELAAPRVLHDETELTAAPIEDGVMISTGDGGGAGPILGLGAPLHVRPATFRRMPCWEIGSPRVATYVDDNGIRLDDGMLDRLRVRLWPLPLPFALAGVLARVMGARWKGRVARWAGPLLLIGALLLAWQIA